MRPMHACVLFTFFTVYERLAEPAAVSDDSDSTDQHAANSTCNQQANGGSQKRSTAIRKSLEKGPNRVSAGKPKQPDQDAMQELSKERRRRAFIGMLRCVYASMGHVFQGFDEPVTATAAAKNP